MGLSAVAAALPILTLVVLLGAARLKARWAAPIALAAAPAVAIGIYGMPVDQAAKTANTVGYEFLTQLSRRAERIYVNAPGAA